VVYGNGRSVQLLGEALRAAKRGRTPFPAGVDEKGVRPLFVATKIPPKNMRWPASEASTVADTYPPGHITGS
jgi:hypothetical protein